MLLTTFRPLDEPRNILVEVLSPCLAHFKLWESHEAVGVPGVYLDSGLNAVADLQ
jgi:hypothetical protein